MPLPHEVRELTRLPRLVGWRLRRRKKAGATGLLLSTRFRVAPKNTLSRHYRVITVFDGRRTVCGADPMTPGARWRTLPPGVHTYDFVVQSNHDEVSFRHRFELAPGQVLVAHCVPSYSLRPFTRNPPPEVWYLGIV